MGLNEQQKIVVGAGIDAAINVTAGAGTGKTRVLVERYLQFVGEGGIPPSRILALTFTLKAADEMRRRIYELVAKDQPALLRRLDEAWIMNFHSFGYRLIRDNAPAAGIDPGVDVATATDVERIEKLLKSRFIMGAIEGIPEDFGGDVPAPTRMDGLFDSVMKIVRKCRDEVMDPAELRGRYRDTEEAGYKAFIEIIIALNGAYRSELHRRRLIDFSDMIAIPAGLLREKPYLGKRYSTQFDHILVDEFQDTSTAQYKLLCALAGDDMKKVTVVGDEKQAIYRWRDARVENIRDFPGVEKNLSFNYRSTQGILDLAHKLICKDPDYGRVADRIRLKAARQDESREIVVFHPEVNLAEPKQNGAEAGALAGWIRHLTEGIPVEGLPSLVGGGGAQCLRHEDIAILLRTLKASSGLPNIERALEQNGIPYTIVGGANAAEARALTGYHALLSLLLPGDKTQELLLVLENRPFSLDDKSLRELLAAEKDDRPFDVGEVLARASAKITGPGAAAPCGTLSVLLDELKSSWISADFRTFILTSLEKSCFYHRLFADGGTRRSADDITSELFRIADDLDKRNELNLAGFLVQLRAAINTRSFGRDKDLDLPPGKVRIMTIHQAKGLEFPAVAVAGIKKSQGSSDGFFLSKTTGLYTKENESWKRSYDKLDEYEAEKNTGEQEERCLLYVAITRARDYLFVSSPFADGIERHKKKYLFADILDCFENSTIPHVMVRKVPKLPGPPALVDETENGGRETELEDVVLARKSVRLLSAINKTKAPERTPVKSVTWPALYAYASCPAQYRYKYYLKLGDVLPGEDLQEESSEDIPAVSIPDGVTRPAYGSIVHEVLFYIMRCRAAGSDTTDVEYDKIAGKYSIAKKHAGELQSAVAGLIRAFDDSELAQPGTDIKLEEPFQVRIERAVFQGIFDRVERVDKKLRVIDYKIGREHNKYHFQVSYYAWALGRITGEKEVAAYLCYLRDSGLVLQPVRDINVDAYAGALEDSLTTGMFGATPSEPCGTCPYISICPDAILKK